MDIPMSQSNTWSQPWNRQPVVDLQQVAVGPQNLSTILTEFPYLPPQSVLFGLGLDGLPILLNLLDPAPESILIAGKQGCGKTAFLKSMLRFVASQNSPHEVKALVLANDPTEWDDITQTVDSQFLIDVRGSYERKAGDLIMAMAAKAEQRRYGRELGPSILVLIDNLEDIYKQDYDATLNFEWLIHEGASSQVWPIAAIESKSALNLARWVNRFRTRIIGKVDDKLTSQRISGSPNPPTILSDLQFAVRLVHQWKPFWIPQ